MAPSVAKTGASWGRVRVMPLVIFVQAAVIAVLLWQRMTPPAPPAPARNGNDAPQSRPEVARVGSPVGPGADSRAIEWAEAAYRLATLVRTPRPESETTGSPSDPIGIVVYGRVVDEKGVDILSASIEFEDENGATRSSSDENDWHVTYGLHPGNWSVTVTGTGFRAFKADIVLSDSAARFRYDAVLSRSTIVFVKFEAPDGGDLEAALRERVETSLGSITTAVATAFAPASDTLGDAPCLAWLTYGAYGLRRTGIEPPEGCDWFLDVDQPPPFSVSALFGDAILATREVNAPLEVVVFKIGVGAIESKLGGATLRVVDAATGLPIEGATVGMDTFHSPNAGEDSAADGRVTLRKRVSGLVCLVIEARGYEDYERWLFLGPGENRDFGDVRLDPATIIKGRLIGPDGRAVAGTISCFRLDRESLPRSARSYWDTRADGSFEIGPVGRGRYLVQGEDGKSSITVVVVDTSAGDVRDAVLRLGEGATVTFDLDLGGRERILELRNSAGQALQLEGGVSRGPTRLKAILAPGTYTFSIRDGIRVVHTRQITVGTSPLRIRASG